MMLIGLLFIGLFVYLFVTPKYTNIKAFKTSSFEDPIEIAKVRLARGEITIEEFETIKKVIL